MTTLRHAGRVGVSFPVGRKYLAGGRRSLADENMNAGAWQFLSKQPIFPRCDEPGED